MRAHFDELISEQHPNGLQAQSISVMQCNITRTCNLSCAHCHVESSPKRQETMSWDTMQRILDVVAELEIPLVDITGGAPEMHPDFKRFVAGARALGARVQIRSNLTIHLEPGYEDFPQWLADNQVGIVASLPCYLEENVDKQRGKGVFNGSVRVLQQLNALGYGTREDLPLDLVYNPVGPSLPGPQEGLEQAYKKHLAEHFDIQFSQLFAITNMPIGRWARWLDTKGELDGYYNKLIDAYNPGTIPGLMCLHQISVDWDGSLYDCDFNLAMGLHAEGAPTIFTMDAEQYRQRTVKTGNHCLGCTAGCGSSCGGALVEN